MKEDARDAAGVSTTCANLGNPGTARANEVQVMQIDDDDDVIGLDDDDDEVVDIEDDYEEVVDLDYDDEAFDSDDDDDEVINLDDDDVVIDLDDEDEEDVVMLEAGVAVIDLTD